MEILTSIGMGFHLEKAKRKNETTKLDSILAHNIVIKIVQICLSNFYKNHK